MPTEQAPAAQPATACAAPRPHPHPGGAPPTHHPLSAYRRKSRAGRALRANLAPIGERRRMSPVAQDILELTPEQREIQAVCREFAEKEIRPISLAVDEADTETPRGIWYKAAALGLTSFLLPERFG